jgi:adenylate kinase
MRVIMLAPPGAGKGTQGERIAARYGIPHISSGDIFRDEVARQTPLGKQLSGYLDHGDLVPDELVLSLIRGRVVAAAEKSGGYVLDGFPRTVEQAEVSFRVAQPLGVGVQAAVHLDVPRAELVRRLLRRQRGSDDTEAVIENRLQVYLDKTVPLLEYYAGREWMFTVDAARPADAVHQDIVTRLAKLDGFATRPS